MIEHLYSGTSSVICVVSYTAALRVQSGGHIKLILPTHFLSLFNMLIIKNSEMKRLTYMQCLTYVYTYDMIYLEN